jgi:hypothetical protein
MFFNKAQRNELAALCDLAFNNPGAYRKILKDPQYQIVTGYREDPNTQQYKYVSVSNGAGKKPSIVRVNKTMSDEHAQVPVTRQMTFEELRASLVAIVEMQNFSAIHKEDENLFYTTIVARSLANEIINRPWLSVAPADKDQFDQYFSTLAPEQKEMFTPFVTNNTNRNEFCVDGLKFVLEVMRQNDDKINE